MVGNPTTDLVTKMQGWDYRLGINGIKRMQSAYNSALVAQGAFSAYWTEDLRAVGGWPDAIGEDIVLTWTLMDGRGIVTYEPIAVGWTLVPERVRQLMKQRSRWARGMLEGIRANPPHKQPRVLTKFVAGIDYLVPLLDIGYVFFWIPGAILFVFGYPLIVSWWSMLVIPITLVHLRPAEAVAGALGLQTPGDRGRTGQAGLLRLPVRLSGADFDGRASRICPAHHRSRSAVGLTRLPSTLHGRPDPRPAAHPQSRAREPVRRKLRIRVDDQAPNPRLGRHGCGHCGFLSRAPDGLVASSPVFSSAGHRNHRPTAAAATTIAHTA